MRNPERISKILSKIEKIWKDRPDLRLVQLIHNIESVDNVHRLYNIEDDELVDKLEDFYMMNKCPHCDYETKDDLGKHLNEKHVKCICGTVFDKDQYDDNYALCEDCRRERWGENWRDE